MLRSIWRIFVQLVACLPVKLLELFLSNESDLSVLRGLDFESECEQFEHKGGLRSFLDMVALMFPTFSKIFLLLGQVFVDLSILTKN